MHLDSKVLELTQSVSYGSVTLKSLQNDNIPELDLLVREAIQNSSDASLSITDKNYFTVKFNTGVFQPTALNSKLTGVTSILEEMFPDFEADFLEIRDSETQGLTGPVRMAEIPNDNHGNFFKLIFDTGKEQRQIGAGGNWGFGKSVYYRVGIGIVIFYSRIKTETDYESRLIITLVEDEEKNDSILLKINSRAVGKAWWGIKDNQDLLPITDEKQIEEFLRIFNIRTFQKKETGTSVIIPYIKKTQLLKNIIPEETEISADIRERCTWATDFEEYLKLAIQKWYAPKIQNLHLKEFCDKKWLRVYVNNKGILYDTMLPFFRLVQELYTIAISRTYNHDYKSEWLENAGCFPVNIRNYFDTSITNSNAGFIAAVKIDKEQLYRGKSYLDPCIYTRHFENDPDINEPIVMYTRDPGMVIEYSISGPWVKNITPPENNNEYIFAFFVPKTDKKLKKDLSEKKYSEMLLGEYLRECEASDHMGWKDPANMQIVQRIQRRAVKQIKDNIIITEKEPIEATTSKLSGKLGKMLLPRIGYGRLPGRSATSGGSGAGSSTRTKDFEFEIQSSSISGMDLELSYQIKFKQNRKLISIVLLVDSEGGLIDPRIWEKDIATAFPLEIKSFHIDSISTNTMKKTNLSNVFCNHTQTATDTQYLSLALTKSSNSYSAVSIEAKEHFTIINGRILIHTADKKYRLSFKIS